MKSYIDIDRVFLDHHIWDSVEILTNPISIENLMQKEIYSIGYTCNVRSTTINEGITVKLIFFSFYFPYFHKTEYQNY